MRHRDDLMMMGKVHSSVQEMLAEARQIVSPSFSAPKSQCSHMEVYLPATKINQHLKEILRGPSGNYKKIERSKRYSSVALQNYGQRQEKDHSNLMTHTKNKTYKHIDSSSNRYALDSIMANVQNQVLDKRNKRNLCDKKTINLLPDLPPLPRSQAKDIRRIESYYQKIEEWAPKYYYTITEKPSSQLPYEAQNEAKQESKTIQNSKQQTIKDHQKNKRVKSQLLRNPDKPKKRLKQQKATLEQKPRKIEPKKEEIYDPQPWILELKKDEYFDFNNF